jgi:hypothetical protein
VALPAPLRLPSKGTDDDFAGDEGPEHEDDHSRPSSAEVKIGGALPTLPHMPSQHSD